MQTSVTCTKWHRDLDLWPWRSWRLSVIRILVLHLCTKFEIRRRSQFGRYDRLSVSALVALTFDLLTSKTSARYCTWSGQFSCQMLIFLWDFSFSTHTHHMTLRFWPLILEVMALVGDTGPRAPSVYQVWSSYAFRFRRWHTFADSINRPGDLDRCPFYL